jgi:putative nucleotidyltransferase with HDIG domain
VVLTVAADRPAPPSLPADRIDGAQVRQRVRELPPLPKAALDALAALRDEQTSSQHCADLIGRDQALVARTLRLANSAFYGVPGRVATTRDAVHLLGRRTLGSVITVATLSQQFPGQGCPGFSFAAFWRHAMATALASRAVARSLQASDETAFTTGLLHDVGRLALAAYFPLQMSAAIRAQHDEGQAKVEAENATLGTNHVEVGALIATHWNFPAEVSQAIAGHHAPLAGAGSSASLADIVHVADAIAHALDLAGDADEVVPELDRDTWNRVGLSTPAVLAIFSDTEAGVAELCRVMDL